MQIFNIKKSPKDNVIGIGVIKESCEDRIEDYSLIQNTKQSI